jgi:predicted dehydrogenase
VSEGKSRKSRTKALKVGVVGLGWAGRTHLESYLELENVHVVAVADLDGERRTQAAKSYAIPNTYADYEELVGRDDLDIVSVATPNFLHAPVSIAALNGGKHVLCEKPLARSSIEARSMVEAASRAGRVLKVAFNHRARPDVELLKRQIDMGNLGQIYHAKAYWLRRSGIPGLGSWFTNKDMAGGGPLIDLGVHVLDMALYLMGEPEAVTVSAATFAALGPRGRGSGGPPKMQVGSSFEVEDLATALVRFRDGRALTLETSWASYRKFEDEYGVALFGTEGGAEINVARSRVGHTLSIYTDTADLTPELPTGNGYGHRQVVREFVDVIRNGDHSLHTGRDGLYRAQIIDACYRSAELGSEVSLG